MIRRQIKNDENDDRLFDFIKCREIKKWNEQEKAKDDPIKEEPSESKVSNLDAQHLETLQKQIKQLQEMLHEAQCNIEIIR